MNKAVFLDRDGTLIYDRHYCSKVEDVDLIPGAAEAVRIFNDLNLKVIIVTNQSGVGRGLFTHRRLGSIHRELWWQLSSKKAIIDAIYYCPHTPEDGCLCRKPKCGMLLMAEKDLNISLDGSYIIGDKVSDVKAGASVGCTGILIADPEAHLQVKTDKPEHLVRNLFDAAMIIDGIVSTAPYNL